MIPISYRFAAVSTRLSSIFTPGPIVDETVMLRRYLPFAAAGFAFTMLSSSADAFSIRFCGFE